MADDTGIDEMDVLTDSSVPSESEDKEEKDTESESESDTTDEDEEDKDEEEDKEAESEEGTDEDEEEEERISYVSDIKGKFPEFFKQFPDVKAALYRDQRYSEIFASPKDAEDALRATSVLNQIQKDLVTEGNPAELLSAIRKDNAESYQKVVYSVLPWLAENDKELYYEVAALPIKQLLRSAYATGREENGELSNLGKAALFIHDYFFNDKGKGIDNKVRAEDILPKKEKGEKEKEYEKRLNELDARDFDNFFNSVNQSYTARMSNFIKEGIKDDGRLTEWTKSKLVEEGMARIRQTLNKDPRYTSQLESLWRQARAANYSNDLKSRILNTALARAKSLVPKLRSELIKEALGKSTKKLNGSLEPEKKQVGSSQSNGRVIPKSSSSSKKPLNDLDILRGR